MATRFWVGGTGSWDASTTTHWASSSNGAGGQTVPVSGDTVTFDANSGGGTVTITAATVPTTGNITTFTCGAFTGTINTNGNTVNVSGTMTISGTGTRTITLGASAITCGTWTATTTTNLTFNSNTSSITMTANTATFDGGGLTYRTVVLTGQTPTIGGANTFTTLTRTGTASLLNTLTLGADQTTTTFNCNGQSAINRLLVLSSASPTTARTISATTVSAQHADFQDITGAGASGWALGSITGKSGDCGGNSGITFTASATQTWSGTSGGNWSTNAWTTRVPLPQDDVVISSAFSAAQTITADMPRMGRSIDFTGTTGAPILSFVASLINSTIFGSLTLASGMTTSGGTSRLNFSGRSSSSITSNGVTFAPAVYIVTSSTYTLADAFAVSVTGAALNGSLVLSNGTLTVSSNVSITGAASAYAQTGGTLNMGSGTWSLGNTAGTSLWFILGGTINSNTSTIVVSNTSTNTRTFNGNGQTYNVLTYTVAGSTGQLTIATSNTFNTINFSDASNARTLQLTAATTTTITNSFNVNGTVGKLMTLNSSGAAATLSKASGIVTCDYLSISNSTATGGANWFAGTHSTDGGGNTGWLFTQGNFLGFF